MVRLALSLGVAAASGTAAAGMELPTLSHAYAGTSFAYQSRAGDTVIKLSSRFGQAAVDLARNNNLDRAVPIETGTPLHIDNHHIVPKWLERGILINIPQRMLFRFENNQLTASYPVSLGKPDWPTPAGSYSILSKQAGKTWIVPESIQEEMRQKGLDVKTAVPPGPENPLGRYWMGTSAPGIGIHGTIMPASIYGFHSHGCIRLHPDDAEKLFGQTSRGLPLEIIYQPLLMVRLSDGAIHVEVHRDIYRSGEDRVATARRMAAAAGLDHAVDWGKVEAAVREQAGALRDVSAAYPTAQK
jgi:L,D-transpeptidase ErfK/SrfK